MNLWTSLSAIVTPARNRFKEFLTSGFYMNLFSFTWGGPSSSKKNSDANPVKSNTTITHIPMSEKLQIPIVGRRPCDPDYTVVTARFGDKGPRWETFHKGIDFAPKPEYSNNKIIVYAFSDGIIGTVRDQWHDENDNSIRDGIPYSLGNRIWQYCETEKWTAKIGYCHLADIFVDFGKHIKQGDPIGILGGTGNVTAPHLHLEVRRLPGNESTDFDTFWEANI